MRDDDCICLNGLWETGDNRVYTQRSMVPGIQRDPETAQVGKLWLRRSVRLPERPFSKCCLLLKGARFCPALYVNGLCVARSEGGMAPVRLVFSHPDCIPGATVVFEICLMSLHEMPEDDASRIPIADEWRTNISSGIWDDVELQVTGDRLITNLVPHVGENGDCLSARLALEGTGDCTIRVSLYDESGAPLAQTSQTADGPELKIPLKFPRLQRWSPRRPTLYQLVAEAITPTGTCKQRCHVAWRRFETKGKAFFCNEHRESLRGISIVWHRFCRDPEGREIAFNREWFQKQIFDRVQTLGANLIRFHLGLPPEWMLDEADRRGIWVQMEWCFFHGMTASTRSLRRQWGEVLSVAARHPSVCIFHPWNETEGRDLERAKEVLEELTRDAPPIVISHRDVIHLHKYWWSLFENLSLSYDSADDFPKPVMADEFGGNYLDGNGDPSLYPEAGIAFERFLGSASTAEERLELQAYANCRVAEYWRRIGAAGFTTFSTLGSPQDGGHHFLGALSAGIPKPVWEACSAAFAPRSVCLEMWNRACVHDQLLSVPLHYFNDDAKDDEFEAICEVADEKGTVTSLQVCKCFVPAWGRASERVTVRLPKLGECCTLRARLKGQEACSSWKLRLYEREIPDAGYGKSVCILDDDPEIKEFVRRIGFEIVAAAEECDVMVGTQKTLERINAERSFCSTLENGLKRGTGLLLLNIGPQSLGEGYLSDKHAICVDGISSAPAHSVSYELPFGMRVRFDHLPEPESCCHRAEGSRRYWEGLQRQALQISNGYRGGLNVPAEEMTIDNISRDAFATQWRARNITREQLTRKGACCYELSGFYVYAPCPSESAREELRKSVKRLVEDAPSLAVSIDPSAPVKCYPVSSMYESLPDRDGRLYPIARCGRGLSRNAAVLVELEGAKIILSQILTAGRLLSEHEAEERYSVGFDPELVRLTRNMLVSLL